MIHSFNLNAEEEKRFQQIVMNDPHKSESSIIRERFFRRRERNLIKVDVVDLQFLSSLSNIISAMSDNHQRDNSITEELSDLKEMVNNKLREV